MMEEAKGGHRRRRWGDIVFSKEEGEFDGGGREEMEGA